MSSVAFLGAGLLGAGFVESLAKKGHTVRVYNRTFAKAEALASVGATPVRTVAEAVAGVERVHICLTADEAVDAVIAEALPALAADIPIYDHTTCLPARVAARTAELREKGIEYVSAPVFMNPKNARDATGLLLLVCPPLRKEAHELVLQPMTGKVLYLGDRPDLAAVNKLLGNGMVIGLVGVLADVFNVARGAGVPDQAVLALLQEFNPAGVMAPRAKRIAEGDFTASFTLQTARKDVRLMIETAGPGQIGALGGMAAQMDRHIAAGEGELDYSVVGKKP